MIAKPRRWLAYKIELNDLLPEYELLLDRFEQTDIPLDATFGSNTEPGIAVPGIVLAIGPAVEPARLAEILALLDGIEPLHLKIHREGEHAKVIFIGALNLQAEGIVPLSDELRATLDRALTAAELVRAIEDAPRIAVLARRP
jgi:hypothetical protein